MSDDSDRTRRMHALYASMCVGAIAFTVAFVYPLFVSQEILWYYPLERRWAYEVKPTGLAMDFYGRLVLGIVAWSVTVVPTILVVRRRERVSLTTRRLLLAWAVTVALFAMFYFVWTLYLRVPMPEPIPDWYRPR